MVGRGNDYGNESCACLLLRSATEPPLNDLGTTTTEQLFLRQSLGLRMEGCAALVLADYFSSRMATAAVRYRNALRET